MKLIPKSDVGLEASGLVLLSIYPRGRWAHGMNHSWYASCLAAALLFSFRVTWILWQSSMLCTRSGLDGFCVSICARIHVPVPCRDALRYCSHGLVISSVDRSACLATSKATHRSSRDWYSPFLAMIVVGQFSFGSGAKEDETGTCWEFMTLSVVAATR